MNSNTTQLAITSHLVEKNNQYSFVIMAGEKIIVETPKWFDSEDEAGTACSAVMKKAAVDFKENKIKVRGERYSR